MTHKGTPSRSFNFLTRKRRVSLWEVALAGALLSSSRALGFVIDLASVAIPSTSTLRQSQKQVIHNNHALKCSQRSRSCLFMTSLETSGQDDDRPLSKKEKQGKTNGNATSTNSVDNATLATTLISSKPFVDLEARIRQLEQIVSRQEVQIQKLRKECNDLTDAAVAFARMVDLFRQAGLENMAPNTSLNISNTIQVAKNLENKPGIDQRVENCTETIADINYEYFDDSEIFGRAPSSVIDAADAAGAAILAGMLGGKQRMLVDVRDAELSRDPETLVQFVELAILPVAAGLEGLRTARNRVKIVFPTVSQLLQYRRTMALAAPEVVALSTLGFDPIEKQDQLVVLIAPSPDDEEGLAAMNELLVPTDGITEQISQPLVVINHHMLPLSGPAKNFEVAYHLRLLSVHYMSGENKADYLEAYERHKRMLQEETGDDVADLDADSEDDDEALEAAMKHAHEIGMNQGVTRAMVIRAYPKPWHIFVDTSPDTDADFEVAATFDEEPTQDDVNFAIVECLEGSEREDELVAQQMQQALEAGQLDRVADMLGLGSPIEITELNLSTKKSINSSSNPDAPQDSRNVQQDDPNENPENYYDDFEPFEEDSC